MVELEGFSSFNVINFLLIQPVALFHFVENVFFSYGEIQLDCPVMLFSLE